MELARRNTTGRPLVSIVQAAVHDSVTTLTLAEPGAEKWAYRFVEGAGRGVALPTVTIGDVMRSNAAARNLIVKIDIEGGEKELFRSNIDWLGRTDLLIVETHDWMLPGQATSGPMFAALAGWQFEMLQSAENLFFFFR